MQKNNGKKRSIFRQGKSIKAGCKRKSKVCKDTDNQEILNYQSGMGICGTSCRIGDDIPEDTPMDMLERIKEELRMTLQMGEDTRWAAS